MNNSILNKFYFKIYSNYIFVKIHLRERLVENKMERLCVLLYSKYSPMSNKLMTALSSCPLDLKTLVGLSTVCVDNEEIRKQILKKDNKIEISSVPCVLIVYNTGGVEKYEGRSAFEWIEETINRYLPIQTQSEPQLHIKSEQAQSEFHRQRQRRQPQFRAPKEETENEYIDEPEPEPEAETEHRHKKSSLKRPKKETTMEELGINKEESETQVSSGKGKDLMSAAMAMQKERDSSEPTKGKDNPALITNKRPV
jgi:hypothetical protein